MSSNINLFLIYDRYIVAMLWSLLGQLYIGPLYDDQALVYFQHHSAGVTYKRVSWAVLLDVWFHIFEESLEWGTFLGDEFKILSK